jgi:hypothetical protein
VRVRYRYNYFDLARGGWFGYHLHPVRSGGDAVPHAKCVTSDGGGATRHHAAYEIELLAAHDDFEAWYAAGRRITCGGLVAI